MLPCMQLLEACLPDVSSFLRVLTHEGEGEPLADIRVDADIVYVSVRKEDAERSEAEESQVSTE